MAPCFYSWLLSGLTVLGRRLRHYFPSLRAPLPAACAQCGTTAQVWGDTGPRKQRLGESPAGKGHPEAEGSQLQGGLCGPTTDLSKHHAPLRTFILLVL